MKKFISEKSFINDDKLFSHHKTIYNEDQKYLKIFFKYNKISFSNLSLGSIRIKFNKTKLFHNKISLEDIIYSILTKYPYVEIIPLDQNIVRIYINVLFRQDNKNELTLLSEIYNYIDVLKLSGIDGINGVQVTKIDTLKYDNDRNKINEKETILYTNGINLTEIMKLTYIDELKTISNETNEIYRLLGIEAARRNLLESIYSVIINNGANVNPQIIHLLVDYMTHEHLLKINYYGMKHMEPFQKIAFERQLKGFTDAAIKGEIDNMTSVSASVMTCQESLVGSGLTKYIML